MKLLFRRILRQPVIYGIKIVGLILGVATTILLLTYVKYESNYDKFHYEKENIYRLIYTYHSQGSENTFARTAPAYIPTLKNHYSEVFDGFRLLLSSGFFEYQNKKYIEDEIYFVDASIFNVLTFNFIQGDSEKALESPNTVVISKSIKEKYFGNNLALGQTILLVGNIPLEVTGVIDDYPDQSHLNPELLVSWGTYANIRGVDLDNIWQQNIFYSYVKLSDEHAFSSLNFKLNNFLTEQTSITLDQGENINLQLQPLTSIHLTQDLLYDISVNTNKLLLNILTVIAAIILIISIINFVSLALVLMNERFEESGIKKVFGAGFLNLTSEYLLETVVLTYISVLGGYIISVVLLPIYIKLTSIQIDASALFYSNFYLIFLIIPVIIILLAGIYPAVKFASFSAGLKKSKSVSSKGDGFIRNSLVTFQFCISLVLIIMTLVIFKQMNYISHYDYGFNTEGIILLPFPNEQSEILKSELLNINSVASVTFSGDVPGNMRTTLSFETDSEIPNKNGSTTSLLTDYDFLDTYDIELIAGRNFLNSPTDLYNSIILNKEAVTELGWTPKEAIGKSYRLDPFGGEGEVIGVTDNFHVYSLHKKMEPVAMAIWPDWLGITSVKITQNQIRETISEIKKVWVNIGIEEPFTYEFLEDEFESQYKAEIILGNIFTIFSSLSILISCLGLFGLILHKTKSMEKEISIRKILGATAKNVVELLLKDVYKLIGLAIIFSIPITYLSSVSWMNNFSYKTSIGFSPYAIAVILLIAITSITISYNTIKASIQDPVKGLRSE